LLTVVSACNSDGMVQSTSTAAEDDSGAGESLGTCPDPPSLAETQEGLEQVFCPAFVPCEADQIESQAECEALVAGWFATPDEVRWNTCLLADCYAYVESAPPCPSDARIQLELLCACGSVQVNQEAYEICADYWPEGYG
jgi:hypothetical protein